MALGAEVQAAVQRRAAALSGEADAPYVCPFLDERDGACPVYDQRPVGCRTYGYYVERDQGLYCDLIRSAVERGECEDVVWGNQSAVERDLGALGPRTNLVEWIQDQRA